MTLFEEIISESVLLTEIGDSAYKNIISAINNMYRMQITYDSKRPYKNREKKGHATRSICPFVFGKYKGGELAIAGYETTGSTQRGLKHSDKDPHGNPWKVFLLKDIVSYSVSKGHKFDETVINDPESANNFNPNGDSRFTTIYAISPLCAGHNETEVQDINQPIDSKPITKGEIKTNQEPEKKLNVSVQPKRVQSIEPKQQNTIDNTQKSNYTNNALEAPETAPVAKKEINGNDSNDTDNQYNIDDYKDEPVTKQEVENPELTKTKDLMRRMGLLDKDEDNNEEIEETY